MNCSNRWLVPHLKEEIPLDTCKQIGCHMPVKSEPSGQPCLGWWVCARIQCEAFGAPRSVQGTFLCGHPSSVQESVPCAGLPWPCRGIVLTWGQPWRVPGTPPSDSLAFCRGTSLSPGDGWGTCPAEILCGPLCSGEVCQGLRGPEDWLRAF